MTRLEAKNLIAQARRELEQQLDKSVSQFQIRLAYVTAHEELEDLARHIIDNLDQEEK